MKLYVGKHGKSEDCHSKRRRTRRTFKSVLPLSLVIILAVCLIIGGTLAFMKASTGTVTNSFKAGEITYTLNLVPNKPTTAEDNNNVGMPSELDARQSTALSVDFTPDKNPTLTGYTFSGWYYDDSGTEAYPADCLGDNYSPITVKYGDSHDSDPDANKVVITLYAKWTPNTYEVEYNGNGATAGNMDNSGHIYDVAKNLTQNAYTRTGFAFLGWSADADAASAEYEDEASVINLTSEPNGKVTLYAVWKQMDFTVTFDTQVDGVTASPGSKTVTYQNAYGDLATASREGYILTGWYLDQQGTELVTAETIVDRAEDHTLYAQWTPITYTVVYDKNGDDEAGITGSTANSTHTYDVGKNLTENGYERTGYTFIGWNTQADGKGKSYANGESVVNLASTQGATVTLYAQWGAKSYVIRYHANGGEGTMADQTIKYDVPTDLNPNAFTKDDHSFMGWALTSNGEVKYIDKQTVVNLLESGTLDLYAVWGQNSHTVTFDYNGGSGSPESKQVMYGKAYGQLPEYPVHPTEIISDNEVMTYLFTGWYTERTGGTRVYPTDIVNRTDDHTLYAHWEEAPSNNVIQNMIVKNNPDDNMDGVVDDIYLQFTCTSTFEKYNIPLNGLVPGQAYKLTYTASNDASFGDYIRGYKNSVYGSYILADSALTGGRIENNYEADEYVAQILADWNSRVEADGDADGSQAAINDSLLQGPWKDKEIVFTATSTTMYWTWDFGLMEDNIQNNYNITNIVLEPVVPEIKFGQKTLVIHNTSKARVLNDVYSDYATNFVFDGDGYAETMYYPITGLTAGTTYTITFDHKFSGALINNTNYDYGCGIMNSKPTKFGSYMSSISDTWASATFVMSSVTGNTETVTLTFTATGDTAYWVWNMANVSDNTNSTIDVKVTNFSAKHKNGGSITYYNAASAATIAGLTLNPVELPDITFDWSGIDDSNMDGWYPVDEQNPVAGDDYELAFEPMDGYTMTEIITVTIDGATYEVYTDGRATGEDGMPAYDPETNVLTIPGELLTPDTMTVAVVASAVPADISIPTEPSDEEGEAGEGDETITAPVEVTMNLTNMTAQGSTASQTGTDYTLVLTPDEGYEFPEILQVEVEGVLYEVYTDGLEHRVLAEGETELLPMPAFDPTTDTLTIPASLLDNATESVTITSVAVEIAVVPTETDSSGEDTQETSEDSDKGAELAAESSGDATALPPEDKEEEVGDDNTDDGNEPDDINTDSSGDTATSGEGVAE